MAAEGEFPKSDGDVLYAREVNTFDSNNIYSGIDISEVSASDSNATKTIASASVWILKNTGSSNVYINFGATASTSNFYLKPSEEISFQLQETQLNYICDTSETSDLSIIGGVGQINRYTEFLSSVTNVTTSSTEIYNDTQTYKNWLISNDGAVDVYIRFSATATTSDFRIAPGESLNINYEANRLDGITASSTADIRVFAVGE